MEKAVQPSTEQENFVPEKVDGPGRRLGTALSKWGFGREQRTMHVGECDVAESYVDIPVLAEIGI
jgi:hypothetical protein